MLYRLLKRRVRAPVAAEDPLGFHGLRVDLTRREVTCNGRPVSLRRKEYELLLLFLRHPGQLITRDRVSRTLWSDDVIVTNNVISVHIRQLRARLGRFGDRNQTLVGEGYRLDDSDGWERNNRDSPVGTGLPSAGSGTKKFGPCARKGPVN